MKLTVIRHGQTFDNVNGIIQGQLPGRLTELGKQQAQQTAELLANAQFDQAWSSDLKRVIDTAEIVIEPHPDLILRLSHEIREYNFGVMQGKRLDSWAWPRIGDDPLSAKAEGGESPTDLASRITDFINGLLKTSPNDSILVATHGGPIRIMRAIIDNQPLRDLIDEEIPNAKPFEFTISDSLKLSSLSW